MSLQIRDSYHRAHGDPGFLGDVGKFLGGAVKTVVGGVTGFATGGPIGALFGGLSASGILKASAPATSMATPLVNVQGIVPGELQIPPTSCAGLSWKGKCYGGAFGPGTASVGVSALGPATGSGSPVMLQNGQLCAVKGTHLNKTTYTTRSGIVPAGTRCVKNRRMNPLNPSALSRSMRRVASFSRATRSIERELGKLGRAHGPRPRAVASRRGKSCGCK